LQATRATGVARANASRGQLALRGSDGRGLQATRATGVARANASRGQLALRGSDGRGLQATRAKGVARVRWTRVASNEGLRRLFNNKVPIMKYALRSRNKTEGFLNVMLKNINSS
jgi:hypothetical protein